MDDTGRNLKLGKAMLGDEYYEYIKNGFKKRNIPSLELAILEDEGTKFVTHFSRFKKYFYDQLNEEHKKSFNSSRRIWIHDLGGKT